MATVHCPNCGKPVETVVSRDLRPDTALIEVRCAACGLADAGYMRQLANDEYAPLAQPVPANLAQPPADNL